MADMKAAWAQDAEEAQNKALRARQQQRQLFDQVGTAAQAVKTKSCTFAVSTCVDV